jgi:hypothetical protein
MTARQILMLNASSTALSAVAMFVTRSILAPLFGLATPFLLDVTAISFIVYSAALVWAATRQPVPREALLTFAALDAAWVAFSAVILLLFWPALAPIARALVIVVALVVEVFATLQYRAAGDKQDNVVSRPLRSARP